MWPFRKPTWDQAPDRAAEVIAVQQEALEITRGIQQELLRLEETLRRQGVETHREGSPQ